MRHCSVSLSKNINPSLVLVQPRKTRHFIAELLLMGRKESNQTIKSPSQNWKLTISNSKSSCLIITLVEIFFIRNEQMHIQKRGLGIRSIGLIKLKL